MKSLVSVVVLVFKVETYPLILRRLCNMKSLFVSLKARLPGGYILSDLLWSAMDFR